MCDVAHRRPAAAQVGQTVHRVEEGALDIAVGHQRDLADLEPGPAASDAGAADGGRELEGARAVRVEPPELPYPDATLGVVVAQAQDAARDGDTGAGALDLPARRGRRGARGPARRCPRGDGREAGVERPGRGDLSELAHLDERPQRRCREQDAIAHQAAVTRPRRVSASVQLACADIASALPLDHARMSRHPSCVNVPPAGFFPAGRHDLAW